MNANCAGVQQGLLMMVRQSATADGSGQFLPDPLQGFRIPAKLFFFFFFFFFFCWSLNYLCPS
ncbi:MAG: hypothetical protein HFACDABA_00846 [Anaerolineales bacterium]|nr:hypothetical protein [Anaerolineales bacterium]